MSKPARCRRPKVEPNAAPPTATIEIEVPAWDSDGDCSRPNIRAFLLIAAAGGLSLPAAEAAAQTLPADRAPRGVVALGVTVRSSKSAAAGSQPQAPPSPMGSEPRSHANPRPA